ncbi:S41 family peptidase [Clostridium sp. OS1-26]|uniref:S41 family peptidase n=1 Tax=Clostridium sp. OS1-26 TaxID=3070681 RepID=UPI0027DF7733|nr:S41 family peptidase [Clostridium sp. OS1-26]WML34657.1 S41 family peptidase [Clostridium sp. OS1-26]
MNRKKLKIFGIILGVIVVLLLGTCIYVYAKSPITAYKSKSYRSSGNVVLDKKLTKLEVKEDVEKLINTTESTHPIFLEGKTEKYKKAMERFSKETDKDMTTAEFQLSVSRYLSAIQDGHTRVWFEEDQYLNINWRYLKGNLVLLDKNNKPTNKIVKKINGVEINKVMDAIKDLFPAENYAAEISNNSTYSKGKMVLTNSGVDCSKDMFVTVRSEAGEENIKVDFGQENSSESINSKISSKKINDKTVYVKLGICEVNEDLNRVVTDLKEGINNNVKNVIIDVRDNPGGDSRACNMILDSLKIKPGHFGSIIRFSPLAQERYGYLRKSGYIAYDRSNEVVKNKDINLYVITNEETFSSAQWLATLVRDGNLGTIVGQPSSNMPSSFGDVLNFQLDNSKLEIQISYKKWTRPDKSKDSERALQPDIEVEYPEDALNKVFKLIGV